MRAIPRDLAGTLQGQTRATEEEVKKLRSEEQTNAQLENAAHVRGFLPLQKRPLEETKPPLGSENRNDFASEVTPQQEAWFASWWAIYWHKRAKRDAWTAFRRHVTTEARFEVVMAATRAQKSEMLQREPVKRPYGATWLNGERWEDEAAPPPKTKSELIDEDIDNAFR